MSKQAILIVEDESIVALDLETTVRGLGYAVAGVAAEGAEAVALAKERRPDLVLMDIMLNGPMDGIDAAAAIRRALDIPVVFLTAYADEGTLQRAKATAPFGYVLKPFEESVLRTSIEVALHKHELELRLKESEQRLTATLQSLDEGLVATDEQGKVIFLNPLAESLTGWKQVEALGQPVARICPLASKGEGGHPVLRAIALDEPVSCNGDPLLSGTGIRAVAESASPIRDTAGQPIGALMVLRGVADGPRVAASGACDALTGMLSRPAFMDRLAQFMAVIRGRHGGSAILVADVDFFRDLNDRFGAAAGEVVLRQVAQRLAARLGESVVGRLGGDEFAAIVDGIDGPDEAAELAERLMADLAVPIFVGGDTLRITASIGIALHQPGQENDPALWLRRAAAALNRAKAESGGGAWRFCDPIVDGQAQEARREHAELRRLLAEDGVMIGFSPLRDALGNFIGLLSWGRPAQGQQGDLEGFQELATRTGLAESWTGALLRRLHAAIGLWRPSGWLPPVVVLPLATGRPSDDLIAGLCALSDAGLRLDLALPLPLAMAGDPTIGDLRVRGCGLAVTGVGADGMLDPAALRRIDATRYVLAPGIVRAAPVDTTAAVVAETVVRLARLDGREVGASGIVSSAQREVMARLGVSCFEGPLIGPVTSAEDSLALCAAR